MMEIVEHPPPPPPKMDFFHHFLFEGTPNLFICGPVVITPCTCGGGYIRVQSYSTVGDSYLLYCL